MTTVFRLDRGHESRELFDERVHLHADLFADAWGDIAPVRFACAAWRVATPPLGIPAYVRWHRRVLSAECVRNSWDGTLTARVHLVAPPPVRLAGLRPQGSTAPHAPSMPFGGTDEEPPADPEDGAWRGWPVSFGQYVAPTDHDLARGPFLRASVLVETPVPLDNLPQPPEGPVAGFEADAARAVGVLARALDRLLSPVVADLDAVRS
jgi:hypothetical protein